MPLTGSVISVTAETTTTISLSITAPSGGTAPYIYQWSRSLASGSGYANVGTNSTSLADTGLTPGTQYYYQVLVTDSAGTPLTATFGPKAATTNPLVGEGISVTSISQTAISLTATNPTDGTGPFTQQWQRSSDGTTYADLSGKTSLTLTDTGLTAGTNYWYRINFTDANGSTGTATLSSPVLTYHTQHGSEGIIRKARLAAMGKISGPRRHS